MKNIGWFIYFTVVFTICLGNNDNYKNYYLEDPNLCSAANLKQGKIKLDENKYNAAKLINKRDKHNFECFIKVKTASKTSGVVAVIQNLTLRKNETTGQCIDYIKFISEDGEVSRKYCGWLDANWKMDPMYMGPEMLDFPVQENTYLSKIGKSIIVEVFISDVKIKDQKPIAIDVIFTLYINCQYRYHDEFEACHGEVCIRPWYFNDNVINCPYPGCIDEDGCKVEVLSTYPTKTVSTYNDKLSIGSKVIISSMSSLIISFIVFVICIYLCRKYKKFCWSDHWSQPQQTPEAQTPRVIEMDEQPSQSQEQAGDNNLEKDLPPSYESLFPDRQIT